MTVRHSRPILRPMPNGDAQDPPVDGIALAAAQDIELALKGCPPVLRVTRMQIRITEALNEALDRCQALGGRRTV